MKKAIVGFPKCGTVSLQYFLGEGTKRYEFTYLKDGIEKYFKKFPNTRPAIIIRNPADRIWSAYCYFDQFKKMSFAEFLEPKKSGMDPRIGIDDPIEQADYWKYIEPWLYINPLIYKLENIRKNSNFPWKNTARNYRGINDDERILLIKKLEEKNLFEKYEKIQEVLE